MPCAYLPRGLVPFPQVPDIYDAAKHALIHNAYLPLASVQQQRQQGQQQQDYPPAQASAKTTLLVGHLLVAPLYLTARRLADAVVPHEYGLDPKVRQRSAFTAQEEVHQACSHCSKSPRSRQQAGGTVLSVRRQGAAIYRMPRPQLGAIVANTG